MKNGEQKTLKDIFESLDPGFPKVHLPSELPKYMRQSIAFWFICCLFNQA